MSNFNRSQFKNFNLSYWESHGGQDLPYYDELPERRVQRVYIDASVFPQWEDWKIQADIARDAAVMGENPMTRGWVKRGSALPLSGDPPFLAEYNRYTQEFRIWINILCPSESEFRRAVADCKERARRRMETITRYGYLAAEKQDDLPEPLYSTIVSPYAQKDARIAQATYNAMFMGE